MGNQYSAANEGINAAKQSHATMEQLTSRNIAPGVSYAVVDGISSHSSSAGFLDDVVSPSDNDEQITSDTSLFMAYSVSLTYLL